MIKKLKNKGNYLLLIGLVLGLIVSASSVYAYYRGTAKELSYDSTGTWLQSTTVQGALDELNQRKGCLPNNICLDKKTTLALGDYVRYVPNGQYASGYQIDKTKTGWTGTQADLIPNELTLWRVIKLNPIEIVSVNVSSTNIYFKGKTGYLNYAGYLNTLASQYETTGITIDSRHFGYNGQTEFIQDTDPTSIFTNPAPWECSTGGSCSTAPVESQGGGENLYTTDKSLLTAAGIPIAATKPNGTYSSYFASSRGYVYTSATSYYWDIRVIRASAVDAVSFMYTYSVSQFSENNQNLPIRPIVTLSSSLSFYGVGTKEYPMEIITS